MKKVQSWKKFNESVDADTVKIKFFDYVMNKEKTDFIDTCEGALKDEKDEGEDEDFGYWFLVLPIEYAKLDEEDDIKHTNEEYNMDHEAEFEKLKETATHFSLGTFFSTDRYEREFHVYSNGEWRAANNEEDEVLRASDELLYFTEQSHAFLADISYESWKEQIEKGGEYAKQLNEELINEWRGTIGNVGNISLKLDDHGGLIFLREANHEIMHLDKTEVYKLYKLLKNFT